MRQRSATTARPQRPQGIQHFFSPCPRGLEAVLASELTTLGADEVRPAEGGVAFAGTMELCYRVNLHARIPSRVLWRIAQTAYGDEDDVYRTVAALPWPDYFGPERTLRVNVAATHSPLRSLDFITLRIKDAVCDRFRASSGRRPSVDTAQPDVRVHAFFDATSFTVYLDTSGEPLFKRGLRSVAAEAPLRENLAAGVLQLSGWTPGVALLDPMCGGGTFLLEAAEVALQRAPGLRRSFAFQKLSGFDDERWAMLCAQARAAERAPVPLPIFGSDLYGAALKLARENLARAGLEGVVQLKQANVLEVGPPAAAGALVANPPYGVRLGEQEALATLYPKLGDALKQRFAGWRANLLTADLRLPKLIGLKPSRRVPLYNGALECRLYQFELVAGTMRKPKAQDAARGG